MAYCCVSKRKRPKSYKRLLDSGEPIGKTFPVLVPKRISRTSIYKWGHMPSERRFRIAVHVSGLMRPRAGSQSEVLP